MKYKCEISKYQHVVLFDVCFCCNFNFKLAAILLFGSLQIVDILGSP